VLVLWVVARGLAPIGGLSRALANRSPESLGPLQLGSPVPVEIRPLVEALNNLLHRLNTASQAQRIFIADAAHELRTPLTALKLQLQAAKHNGTLHGEAGVVESLEARLNRVIRLAHQLLTMAREDAKRETSMSPVSLRRLAEQSVADMSQLAEVKAIDLGLEVSKGDPADAYSVVGDEHALGILINNLIDNAIRHSPSGGRVDVVLRRESCGVGVDIVDNGPGVPEEELGRVLGRFYRGADARGQGSGLGLAIASTIALRHNALLSVRNRVDAGGFIVSIDRLVPADA
jgi:two-component system, OmpR family, sensor kinase